MGLCASMLVRRKAKTRYPEPRRGTAEALFVVRGDRRPSNPEALVVRVQDSGRRQLQRPGSGTAVTTGGHGRCWQHGTDALGRMIRARVSRVPCAGTGTVGVEPDAPLCTCKTTATDGGDLPGWRRTAPTAPVTPASPAVTGMSRAPAAPSTPASAAMTAMSGATAAPSTPASAAMTPGRPVWQRRILMGMRCELPRFSGLVLYDEHGRQLPMGTPGRRIYRQGKKKTARTSSTTTLRDLL